MDNDRVRSRDYAVVNNYPHDAKFVTQEMVGWRLMRGGAA